jgi:DNA polymerase delta subunit 1
MQIDIDHYTQSTLGSSMRFGGDGLAVLRIFGITEEGNSVLAHVHNFKSYFWVQVPAGYPTTRGNVEKFKHSLNVSVT